MPEANSAPRLPLVDNISVIASNLPPINLFRAAANAQTLYSRFIEHIWLQNVATAHAMDIPQVEIDTLDRGESKLTKT